MGDRWTRLEFKRSRLDLFLKGHRKARSTVGSNLGSPPKPSCLTRLMLILRTTTTPKVGYENTALYLGTLVMAHLSMSLSWLTTATPKTGRTLEPRGPGSQLYLKPSRGAGSVPVRVGVSVALIDPLRQAKTSEGPGVFTSPTRIPKSPWLRIPKAPTPSQRP